MNHLTDTMQANTQAEAADYYVRQALPDDAGEILAMQRELAEFCGYPPERFALTEDHVLNIIEYEDQSQYLVAAPSQFAAADGLAGMLLYHRIPLGWSGASGIYIEDLVVRSQHRHGRGIGRLLMANACIDAIELADNNPEAAFIRLDTSRENNDDTLRFYRGLNMDEGNLNFRLYGRAVTNLAAQAYIK